MCGVSDGPIPTTPSESRLVESHTTEIKLPLLVWIDDNINRFPEDFLRQNDDPSLIRFISDNHRDEHGSNSYLNYAAGENILRYLRGRHYNAPVLIFTGWSVNATQYVTDYRFAGSTTDSTVCYQYISSLAAGGTDDLGWMKFMAAV
ncbi:hypothetical protein L208DRAFT_1393548 [Tricholoma matsutake]|nr:hypothetical protein L208DRAFT_1393548 [Tricholoma matsutake 945]